MPSPALRGRARSESPERRVRQGLIEQPTRRFVSQWSCHGCRSPDLSGATAASDTITGCEADDVIDGEEALSARISVRIHPANPATEIGSDALTRPRPLRSVPLARACCRT
jgi:hypothetical protein